MRQAPTDSADDVWNRACAGVADALPTSPGDRALVSIVLFDSLAQNGGLLHALDSLEPTEVEAALEACAVFELHELRSTIATWRARVNQLSDDDLGNLEARADAEYEAAASSILQSFRRHFAEAPGLYAPL